MVLANDATASGVDDEDLLEIYMEVVNVRTGALGHWGTERSHRALNDLGNPHVRLVPGSSTQDIDMSAFVESTVFEVDIQGYGVGRLSFWRTPELVAAV